jgi:thiol-disulfide isomerase/thioredoxin
MAGRVLLLTLLALLSASCATNAGSSAANGEAKKSIILQGRPTPPVPIGQQAPDVTVTSMAGKEVKLSSLRGKPVLLDFWATWCGPCRVSLPHTQQVATKHAKEITVLSISDEDADKIDAYFKQNGYKVAPYRDVDKSAQLHYKIETVPTFVVIDAQGNLVAYLAGYGGSGPLDEALAKVGVKV